MEKEVLNLPLIIGGKEVEGEHHIRLEYDDLVISFPVLDDEKRKAVLAMDQDSIHNLKLTEIVSFLQRVSWLWYDENYPLRKKITVWPSPFWAIS